MIFSPSNRRETRHPAWCDTSRCQSGNLGGRYGAHRSAPVTLGRVTVVLTQQDHESTPTLEVVTRSCLVPVAGDEGRLHAFYAAMSVDGALQDCASVAREWQNDHSMHREHSSCTMSTPNTGTPGGEQR